MKRPTPKRLLIFVIAYYAEATLRSVLERIPASVFDDYDCEVLVVDDASEDRTFEIGHEYRRRIPRSAMTVLRNEYNQGYGGNQKVGYAYAIANGFDFVAMVHGDGQYAPEELPQPARSRCATGEADAVFGSRMMEPVRRAARAACRSTSTSATRSSPRSQNALLGTKLSEFHSGYRVYSVEALQQHPVPASTRTTSTSTPRSSSSCSTPGSASSSCRSRPTTATRSAA